MKTRSSKVAITGIVAMALCAASGCGGQEGDSDSPGSALSGELEFMTGTGADSPLYAQYEELTEAFQDANPDVSVELVPSSTDHEGEVKTRLASGNAPDIWMTHGWSLLRYSEFLVPLQDEPWAKDLDPALEPIMKDSSGGLYALPIDIDIAGILYNEDVLAEAGYTAADITTWDTFREAADAVKAAGKTPIHTAGKDRWPTGVFVDWLAPGAFTEDELTAMREGTFQPDAYRQPLETVEQFRQAGYFNPDYSSATTDDIARALAEGDSAFSFLMNFVAANAFTYKEDANIGFMPIPSLDGGEPYLVTGEANALGISKETEHPEAAKEYLAFLAQPDNEAALAKAAGSAPGLTSATTDLGGLQDSFDAWVGKVDTVPYFDRVFMPNGAWDSIVSTTESVLTGQSSVDEALEKVQSDYTALAKQGS